MAEESRVPVERWNIKVHEKPGKPPSVAIGYMTMAAGGESVWVNEWLAVESEHAWAKGKAVEILEQLGATVTDSAEGAVAESDGWKMPSEITIEHGTFPRVLERHFPRPDPLHRSPTGKPIEAVPEEHPTGPAPRERPSPADPPWSGGTQAPAEGHGPLDADAIWRVVSNPQLRQALQAAPGMDALTDVLARDIPPQDAAAAAAQAGQGLAQKAGKVGAKAALHLGAALALHAVAERQLRERRRETGDGEDDIPF